MIKLKLLGEEHVDTSATYNNMGAVYKSMSDYKKALEYLEKSLKIKLKLLGEDHSSTKLARANIKKLK
jgi:hypothetical protein